MGTRGTIKQSKLIKFIEAKGFCKRRQRGSHAIYRKDGSPIVLSIPLGRKDAQHYIVVDIMKAFNLSAEELKKELDKM